MDVELAEETDSYRDDSCAVANTMAGVDLVVDERLPEGEALRCV